MQKILIFPYNGNAIEAIDCLSNQYELIGFIDDKKEIQGKHKSGYSVFSREAIDKYKDARILAVVGSPQSYLKRKLIIDSLNIPSHRFATVIHESASISPTAKIGFNVLIMAGSVITSNAVIGNHVCILPNSVIHHDSTIGNYSLIGSNVTVAGFTHIGKNCYIASGSSLINNINIGDYVMVGMGSNVLKPVNSHNKVAGNPAKPI